MSKADSLLIQTLKDPASCASLTAGQWNSLLRQSDPCLLTARLQEAGCTDHAPERVRQIVRDAVVLAEFNRSRLRFEINRVQRAIAANPVPLLLLKGGAYLIADLPPSRGRFASDLDILVRREDLTGVKDAMLAAGWQVAAASDYDERYYETWMHEIAPLWHPERETIVDLHHNIAPTSSRVRADLEALWANSTDLGQGLRVLAPADMVLHASIHLFNEDFGTGLREMADLHELLTHFGKDPQFWPELEDRATVHGLDRLFYYLIYFMTSILGTAVPEASRARSLQGAPPILVRQLMHWLVLRAVIPEAWRTKSWAKGFALWCLYLHSHWLRMPPALLLKHLSIKAWFRVRDSLPFFSGNASR